MSKAAVFIVFISIVIIGLFTLMCYLMSQVNPAPLEVEQLPPKKVGKMILYDHVLFDNEDIHEAPTTDNSSFSLFKSEQGSAEDLATFATVQVAFEQDYSTLTVFTFPTSRFTGTAAPNTLINRTMPLPILKVFNKTEEIDRETTTAGLNGSEILLPVKRSVKEFKKVKGEINSVILRIIDDSGQFNIEIKIGSNDSYWKGNDKNRAKKKPKLSMYLETKHNDAYSNLAKNEDIELNADSIDVSIRDEYDIALSNKADYVKEIDQINTSDNVTAKMMLHQRVGYKDISSNDTFHYNTTKIDDNITDYNDTSKIYKSTSIDDMSYPTYTSLDYINSTMKYNTTYTENSTKMNDTITQRANTNNITNKLDVTFSKNNVTFASNVSSSKNDSKELHHAPSNSTTYKNTANRIIQIEDSTKYNVVDYTNNTQNKSTLHTNNNLRTYFLDNTTESLRPPLSKTVEFIDNALSKVIKKAGNVTKRYKGNIYRFANTDATTENMDIDNLIPMENVNSSREDGNDNIVTVIEKPVTDKGLKQPFDILSQHVKSTVPFKVSIKNNNSLQIKKAIQKDNDTLLKINKSGKYRNLPIVMAKSKEFALDSGSDQSIAVEDTR